MTEEINQRVARRGEQPGLGIFRHAVPRPDRQSLEQGFAQRVYGARQVLSVHRKIRHQATVRLACYPLDRPTNSLFVTATHPVILRLVCGSSGRTSTAPHEAAGQRAAHSRAASSDGNSRMVSPPSCSLVSAYGPSCTLRFPSLILMVVPVSGTCSGSPPTKTPDSTRALR